MQVTQARLADEPALRPLFAAYLQFYQVPRADAEIRAFLEQRLQRGDSHILLARDEQGQALGFVQLYPLFSSLAMRPAWLLNDLFVAPPARRQGVAQVLLQAAQALGLASGACGLQLETARDNLAAQALYERLGFVRDEQFFTYWLALPAAVCKE